jgi:hypothetical protein
MIGPQPAEIRREVPAYGDDGTGRSPPLSDAAV